MAFQTPVPLPKTQVIHDNRQVKDPIELIVGEMYRFFSQADPYDSQVTKVNISEGYFDISGDTPGSTARANFDSWGLEPMMYRGSISGWNPHNFLIQVSELDQE
ncbi:hypothetical protein GOV12_05675 [Candidatus Pacearchaeota archaeon]|nr:hypothetical protein [Candidatus Pacearchaeota archaeon]